MHLKTLFSVIVILIISVGLRIYGLGDRALWADEKVSALCSNGLIGTPIKYINTAYLKGETKTKSFSEIKKATLIQDSGNGLFYYLFLSQWSDWFGNSDYSLRFPSFIAGILFLLVGYLFVKKRFGDNTALLFLISSSVFSLFIIYSQTGRSYELALFTTFLSTYVFWILLDSFGNELNKGKIAVYSITYLCLLCISMFLHYYTFYIFAGHALYLTLHYFKNRKLIFVFFAIYGVFTLLFLYWMMNGGLEGYTFMADRNYLWVLKAKESGTYFNLLFFTKAFITFLVSMTGVYMDYIRGFKVYLLLPYIIVSAIIVFLFFKTKHKTNKVITLFLYTILIQIGFAILMILKNGHVLSLSPYYNIFTIPYVIIILAFISNEILIKRKYAKAIVLFYSVFVVYNLIFIYFYHSKKNIHHSEVNNPYVEAAMILEKNINQGDTVVSRQWIDGPLISLYTKKSFIFSNNPNLEKDEIYLNKKGNDKLTILNLEGKRY
jgi:uncharacterized membrane protein